MYSYLWAMVCQQAIWRFVTLEIDTICGWYANCFSARRTTKATKERRFVCIYKLHDHRKFQSSSHNWYKKGTRNHSIRWNQLFKAQGKRLLSYEKMWKDIVIRREHTEYYKLYTFLCFCILENSPNFKNLRFIKPRESKLNLLAGAMEIFNAV